MNNRGFTLIEMLFTISVISLIMVVSLITIGNTFGLSSEKSYEIMKKGIITQVNQYIYECDNGIINCSGDYVWEKDEVGNKAFFKLGVMKKYGYFNEEDYINPITNEEIGNCLIVNVIKDEFSTITVVLDDNECKK